MVLSGAIISCKEQPWLIILKVDSVKFKERNCHSLKWTYVAAQNVVVNV